jgi:hypothetical protein
MTLTRNILITGENENLGWKEMKDITKKRIPDMMLLNAWSIPDIEVFLGNDPKLFPKVFKSIRFYHTDEFNPFVRINLGFRVVFCVFNYIYIQQVTFYTPYHLHLNQIGHE